MNAHRFRNLAVALTAFAGLLFSQAPVARADNSLDIQEVTSPGGITAWLVQDDSLPLVSIKFTFEGGAALDPTEKAGTASLAASLLTEGAGDLDAQAFSKRLEDRSIRLGFSAGTDSFGGSLKTLKRHLDDAVELARLALTEPRLDKSAIAREKRQLLTSLKRQQSSPRYHAVRALEKLVYADHPYGRPVDGSLASVPQIGRDDMVSYLNTHLARDRLTVAASGAISAEKLGAVLDRLFGELPETGPDDPIPNTTVGGGGETVLVPFPGPQTLIRLAQPGIDRKDPDYYAASIVNYTLGGGGFASRLMEELREKRGLTYGVSSYLDDYVHISIMGASASTSNDQAGEALALLKAEWRRMAQQGLTRQELANAKTYLTGAFPLQLTSTDDIAGVLLSINRNGLGVDYPDRRDGLINGVTLDQANRVARELLQPENLSIVVTGQPQGIEPTRTMERQTAMEPAVSPASEKGAESGEKAGSDEN